MAFTMIMSSKHPLVARDYFVDASNLLQAGVTVTGASITANPAGLTIGTPTINSPNIKVRISGGTDGTVYTVTWQLTLSDGETEIAQMIIPTHSTET